MLDYTSYIMGMNTFDELSQAIRTGYNDTNPSVARMLGALCGKFASGMAIGAGIALVLAVARAGGL